MPVEIIGMIGTRPASEMDGAAVSILGGSVDKQFVREFSLAHEVGDFDRVLVGYGSTGPDTWGVTAYATAVTERLGFLLAHRPGFVAPTLAARKAATLDHFCDGRLALHIISGGSDAEQRRDGDWLDHDGRYRRTDEYLEIVRRMWTAEKPFDYDGEFYHVEKAFSEVRPFQQPTVPLYYGGASEAAIAVGAKHCDCYMFWGEPLADVRERMAEVNAAAAPLGRTPRFSVSVRPILAATEEKAWERARTILARVQAVRSPALVGVSSRPQSVGSQRLLDAAAKAEIQDKRLWTPIAAATGAAGNTTALVGTPEQVAESLLDYYDLGVSTILVRGFDPLPDAIEYGRDLIPLVRAEVARRDRQAVVT